MFTGIIEETGSVKRVERDSRSLILEIHAREILQETRAGDSIAVNGVCLTVTALYPTAFRADVMPETFRCTNIAALRAGDTVNLERALTLQRRIGGHLVSGHVDGTGRIISRDRDENALRLRISTTPDILRYVVEKGSIAVDGISLTVAAVDDATLTVAIIPHTRQFTTLTERPTGAILNLENDILAKYAEKLLRLTAATRPADAPSPFTIDYLKENGF